MPAVFRKSNYTWQCDKCGVFFRAGQGGVCGICKRALCNDDLYGSLWDKMKARFLGERAICVECRSRTAG